MTKRSHILIVEDDEWLAEQYIRTLEAAGFSAHFVANSAAAIDAIDAVHIDVLLFDVLLPGGNIFPLLHELRSHTDLASIPVILCTNSADQLIEEDLAVYGVVCVLDKAAMLPEDMVAAIKKALL